VTVTTLYKGVFQYVVVVSPTSEFVTCKCTSSQYLAENDYNGIVLSLKWTTKVNVGHRKRNRSIDRLLLSH